MRDTEYSDSLSGSLLRAAERLSASTRLAVGGVLWLVLSLAFSCWVQWHMQGTLDAPPLHHLAPTSATTFGPYSGPNSAVIMTGPAATMPPRLPLGFAASHTVWQAFDRTLVLELMDTLVAQALPQALPLAQWRRVLLPHRNGAGEALSAALSEAGSDYGSAAPSMQAGTAGGLPGYSPPAKTSPLTQASPGSPTQPLPSLAGADGVRHFIVNGPCAPLRLGLTLLEGLTEKRNALKSAGARVDVRWAPNGALEILLNHLVYYAVMFTGYAGQLADLAQPLPDAALALVLDDMGQRPEAADEAAALPFAVTFSIWPKAPHASEVAAIAASRRLDCLLHQPMEPLPRADHRRPDPGPGALLTGMSAEEMRTVLFSNLRALPTVIGLNNHMGSAFTGDISLCRTLAGMLEGHGLAVLDSVTRQDPQLALAAREAGLVALARDVFLDTRRDTAAILVALDTAAARARAKGMAVAIGHPYAETLSALRQWEDRDGVAVVPLRRIIWKLAQENAAHAADTLSLNNNME